MQKRNVGAMILCVISLLILILDGKTAVSGMREGIELCRYTIVPSLFPFCFLSVMLADCFYGTKYTMLAPICRVTGIPEECGSLLLIGLLGGYPVGAQNAVSAYRGGCLQKEDAERMAIICNNAGPAFIFGVLGSVFSDMILLWLLWLIQMISSIIIGMILPGNTALAHPLPSHKQPSFTEAVKITANTMIRICSCIVLFRTVLAYLDVWIFDSLPDTATTFLSGVLELSNGCLLLSGIESIMLRFLLASIFISFGGMCVWLQTISVCQELNLKKYLPMKLLQACTAGIVSLLTFIIWKWLSKILT